MDRSWRCTYTSKLSLLFQSLLRDSPSDNPTLVLPDISASTLRNLAAFVHTGEVQVTEEHLDPLLEAARMLQVN